jgi:hypothetical protein
MSHWLIQLAGTLATGAGEQKLDVAFILADDVVGDHLPIAQFMLL